TGPANYCMSMNIRRLNPQDNDFIGSTGATGIAGASGETGATGAFDIEQLELYWQGNLSNLLVDITLVENAFYTFDVHEVCRSVSAGSATLDFKIEGTSIGGLGALAATAGSTCASETGANSVAIGEKLSLGVTGVSSGANLAISMKTTRT
ncbi:hypothetical protein LCGC14_1727500, partial [marine sediment metagenome]